MNGKILSIGRDLIHDNFKTFVNRQIRKRRRDERRFAEQRITKHDFQARKSCVADARSYRIAIEFPLSSAAQLDWKAVTPARRPNIFGGHWLKKFREDQLKHWLTVKQAS